MANGFEKFFETIGHDAKVVLGEGEKLVTDLPRFVKAADDAVSEVKQVVPLVQAVVAASLALGKPVIAIESAVSSAGLNLAADESAIALVVSQGPALTSELDAFVAAVKALAVAIGVDWQQLVADLTTPVAATSVAAAPVSAAKPAA